MLENPKKWWKLIKTSNIDREVFHIFWTTWGISMKFSGKMWLMIILKVTKSHTLSFEHTFFEKPQGGGAWSNRPPTRFRVNASLLKSSNREVFTHKRGGSINQALVDLLKETPTQGAFPWNLLIF